MKRALCTVLSAAMLTGVLAGCGGGNTTASSTPDTAQESPQGYVNEEPIVLATTGGAEPIIIGNICKLLLEDNGFQIDDQINQVQGLDLNVEIAVNRDADITFQYTGNGMYRMGEEGDPVWNDLQTGWERIKEYDLETNNLVWLKCFQGNNTELLAVTKAFAEENNIHDMYDFADYVNNGGYLKLATPQYWVEYEQGLPGLERAYGFEVREDQMVIGDRAEQEVAAGIDGLNCTMVFTTDGILEELGLVVIEDPLGVPPVYALAPVVAKEVLDEYPQIQEILDPVIGEITQDELLQMNSDYLSKGLTGEEIAQTYLTERGYL